MTTRTVYGAGQEAHMMHSYQGRRRKLQIAGHTFYGNSTNDSPHLTRGLDIALKNSMHIAEHYFDKKTLTGQGSTSKLCLAGKKKALPKYFRPIFGIRNKTFCPIKEFGNINLFKIVYYIFYLLDDKHLMKKNWGLPNPFVK